MPASKALHRLTARAVQVAGIGDHSDGGGLVLRVADNGAASWVLRFTSPAGKRREMGLGACARDSIATAGRAITNARELADDARRLLREGRDPIEARDAERERARRALEVRRADAQRERATLARVARDYHERVIEPTRTAKHGAQWLASLENHVAPALWHKPIADVTGPELLDWLIGLQAKVPETASRIRQRLEAIFDDAEFRGLAAGNPARAVRRKLAEASKRRERGHFAALDWRAVPAFMARVRQREGIAARGLEFAVLTAARTGEVIGATWGEFDLQAAAWLVPGRRMKGGQPHTVALSPRALAIVTAAQEWGQDYVFPSPALDGSPLSNMAMLSLLRRMDADQTTTVHGLARAAFSTWAHETGAGRPDVIEACLAHKEADRVKAAYNRSQFAAERAALLAAWADYCAGEAPASNVVPLARTAA